MQIFDSAISQRIPQLRGLVAQAQPASGSGRQVEAEAAATADDSRASPSIGQGEDPLQDPAVQRVLARLAARDREVRAHEQAHAAAGGGLVTSGPSYSYQTGPDGRRYAVGGEVGIDSSPVRGDPEASLRKAARIRAAALAPAQPSGQDLRVAAQADRMAQQARLDLAAERVNAAYLAVGSGEGEPAAGNLISLRI